MFEINGNPVANHGLDLSHAPIRLRWMADKCARQEESGHDKISKK